MQSLLSFDAKLLLYHKSSSACNLQPHNLPTASVPSSCQSLSESVALRYSQTNTEDLVRNNKTLLTRVYPNNSRVDSSNYNPQDYWNAGCQLGEADLNI